MKTVTIENAAGKTKELSAVDLTGSEKQIAWATTIRTEFFSKLSVYARFAWNEVYSSNMQPRDFQALCIQSQEWYLAQPASSFWIDNQDDWTTSFNQTVSRFAH